MGKTVFILGAGASKDLDNGFPTGAELAAQIQGFLTEERERYQKSRTDAGPILQALFRTTGLGDAEWAAMDRIRNGIVTAESIDEFIDEYAELPRLAEIGKLAIVQSILFSESRSLWNQGSDPAIVLQQLRDTWLGRILRFHNRRAVTRRRDYAVAMEGVVFITFNYDRLLEKTLWEHLTTALGVSPDEAIEQMTATPILHVYGAAGRLDSLGGTQPYGSTDNLHQPASQIRTFTEAIDSMIGKTVAAHVASADTICFLGFGFNDRNMEVLFPGGMSHLQMSDGPQIFATTRGVGERLVETLRQELSSHARPAGLRPVNAGQLVAEVQEKLFDYS